MRPATSFIVGLLLAGPGGARALGGPTLSPARAPARAARTPFCKTAGVEEPPLDPRKALEEVGTLVEQVKALWTEGKSWSPAERDERQRELVTQYFRVFVPAVAFSGVQLGVSLGTFAAVLAALGLSHRGYDDLASLAQGFAPLAGALEKVDPSVGNAAIALLVVELLGPLLIGIALAVAPAATASMKLQLAALGLPDRLMPPRPQTTDAAEAVAPEP